MIAVKGTEGPAWFQQVTALATLTSADVVLLAHVIDERPRADLDLGRERFPGRRGLGAERRDSLDRAESDRAVTVLARAREALEAAGVSPAALQEQVLRGKPNEALRDLADRQGVDLIVVGGRRERPDPHSIGKTARFLLDHVPHAAMMVRV